MKVLISVSRITEYTSIVEMDKATFDRLKRELDGSRAEVKKAEKDLNSRIDVKDWQDDDFEQLLEFEEFKD